MMFLVVIANKKQTNNNTEVKMNYDIQTEFISSTN